MSDDGPLRLDGIHCATEEELRYSQDSNDVYDMAKLKLSEHLVANVMQEKKIQSSKKELHRELGT